MCRDGRRCGDCNRGGGNCSNRCESIMRYEGPDIDCVGVTTGDTYETVTRKLSDFICNNLNVDGEDGVGISDITYNPETDTMTINMTDGSVYNLEMPQPENCCEIEERTYEEMLGLGESLLFVPGRTYNIVDRGIWIDAITPGLLSTQGDRSMFVIRGPKYTTDITVNHLGMYGKIYDRGSVPNSSGGVVYTAIWGGRVWERDATGADIPGSDPSFIQSGWTMIPIDNSEYYEEKIFTIEYDLSEDLIWSQRDDRGNVVRRASPSLSFIDITDWGNPYMYNNTSKGVFNNKGMFNTPTKINDNIVDFVIRTNSTEEISFTKSLNIGDNDMDGIITSNNIVGEIAGNTGGEILRNINNGSIQNNDATIEDNNNNGDIVNNNSDTPAILTITNNSNNGSIKNNYATANLSITMNSNNGDIGTTTVINRATDITDPIVNK